MEPTSASLLQRLRERTQEKDWELFVYLYTPYLKCCAARPGLRGQDADDLVQEVFLHLYQKLPEFAYNRTQSFRAWLRKVTKNKYLELCRRRTPLADQQAAGSLEAVEARLEKSFARKNTRTTW